MTHSFHIHLSNRDSVRRFPQNIGSDFHTQLPEEIILPRNEWSCSLLEAHLSSAPGNDPIFICSDICEESFLGERKLPILACITVRHTFPGHVISLKLKKERITTIRVYLTNCYGEKLTVPIQDLYCTPRFERHEADWNGS